MRKRENRGITLIALVITIIVLLILAGVAISMLSGENGILKQAANAKTETEKAADKENKKLQSTTLEMHFVANNKNRKASYGYLTNINIGETAGDLKKDLPKNYKIYNLKGEELQDSDKLETGMTIKDNSGEIISKIIIFGDVDGILGIDVGDAGIVDNLVNEISYDERLEKECVLLAADTDNNGIVNANDSEYILSSVLDEVTIEQNRYVTNPDDILLETATMKAQKELDQVIVGFPTTYEKVFNKTRKCYDVKIVENSLTVEQLKEMFPGKNAEVYERNLETKENILKETGYVGNNYVLRLDGKLCLWFKI